MHCVMRTGDHPEGGKSFWITNGHIFLFDSSAAKQIAITVVCHPLCTRQMSIERVASARRLAIRVDMQHDPSNFLPISAIRLGIEKTPIGHQMLFIVDREYRIIRSCVGDIRIEWWFLHDTYMRSEKGYAPVPSQSRALSSFRGWNFS